MQGEKEFCLTTTLENTSHGANSQCTMILRQLHRTAMSEGKLPSCLYIGADNTPKETKNSTTACFAIWLLASLGQTALSAIEFQYPLVGHTHGSLDRFFSRMIVSLRGRTYWTLSDLEAVTEEHLRGFSISWHHHGSSYDWTYVRQILGMEFTRYRNVNCLRIFRNETGILAAWKQYLTDESWSASRMLVSYDRIELCAKACPPLVSHEFDDATAGKLASFLDRLELWFLKLITRQYFD